MTSERTGRRYDVFLSYNSADRAAVERVARNLRRRGLEPWFDRWSTTPGRSWQDEVEDGVRRAATCAIFIGEHGFGYWERKELHIAQQWERSNQAFRLFMVLLPGTHEFDPATLPLWLSIRTWVDLRPGPESDSGMRELVNAVLGVPSGSGAPAQIADDVCPYRGLEAFDEEHARFYFGRENHVQRLLERLRHDRLLMVVGASGSGKSSLIQAGVLPRVRAGALPGGEEWLVRTMRPGAHPVASLAAQLLGLDPGSGMPETVDRLTQDERTLHLAAEAALADAPRSRCVLLVVDQGEELFTLCRDEAQQLAFLRNIYYATVVPGGRIVMVIALRADFYPRLARFSEIAQLAQSHQVLLGGLAENEIRQVIEEPARAVGLDVEPGLVETIRNDVLRNPGSLPLLQHALQQTWEHRRGGVLTLAGYHATGGVASSLAERAEALYAELSKPARIAARDILLRLTQPGEGTEDTRRRISVREVATDPDRRLAKDVIRRFVDERLLSISTDHTTDQTWVEISHEALLSGWPRLREWIDSDRAGLRLHRRLTLAAQEWQRLGEDDSALYLGIRLREVRPWLDWGIRRLNVLEQRFLRESIAADRAARRARRRRLVWSFATLATVLVVITAMAVVAVGQRDIARSRQLAAYADDMLAVDPPLSLALAMRAYTSAPTTQSEEILRRATADARGIAVLSDGPWSLYSVRFTADDRSVVSTGADGAIRIWDLAEARVTEKIPGHDGIVTGVAINHDGSLLASSGTDGTVALVSGPDRRRQVVVRAPAGGYATGADLSPDGTRLAAALSDGTVRLVDVATGGETVLRTGAEPVYGVTSSRDGRELVTAGKDGTAQIWSAATATHTATLRGHSGAVYAAVFDPAGTGVVTTGHDGTLRLWERATGALRSTFQVDDQPILAVAVSPDGRRVAMGGADGLVRLWSIDGVALATMTGHAGLVPDVAFSSAGDRIISAGRDGTLRIWDPGTDQALRSPASWAAYSPDGRRIVVGGTDGHVRVLGSDGLAQQLDLTGHTGPSAPLFSDDGTRIASAGADGTVRVWNAVDGTEITVLRPHSGSAVWSAAFDPSGTRVLSSAQDGTVAVSKLDGTPSEYLPAQPQAVNTALFAPDGATIVTAGADGVVRLWRSGEPPRELTGHVRDVQALAFGPDETLASAGVDGTIRIWRLDGTEVTVLRGHQGSVEGIDFGPDGRLVSAGGDGTMRLWDVAVSRLLVTFPVHTGPATTVDVRSDGRAVVTMSEQDEVVRETFCSVCGPVADVLDLARARGARALSPDEEQRYAS